MNGLHGVPSGELTLGDPIDPIDVVRNGLDRAAERLEARGIPIPPREGKLLRPLLCLSLVPRHRWERLDDRFWFGALAIQMAHEASLIHDDVIDLAKVRRGQPTIAAELGVGGALVLGDHYLTGAYRAATMTASFEFVERFVEAVERTVAGEVAQGRNIGRGLPLDEYDRVIEGKSGQLFGAAAALGGAVAGLGHVEERHGLGMAFGNFYQRIDDLLDYCSLTDSGKPALQDYRQQKWTWVLALADIDGFEEPDEAVVRSVFTPHHVRPSPARRAIEELRDRRRDLHRTAARLGADVDLFDELLAACLATAERDVRRQEDALGMTRAEPSRGVSKPASSALQSRAEEYVRSRAAALEDPDMWDAYFGEHAKTFRLAARLFPPREATLVTGLYAYCRFTDDLVDEPEDSPSVEVLEQRVEAWRRLSLSAFVGDKTGVALLDTVLGAAGTRGVSWSYPEALLEGVTMDLRPRRYADWTELERYSFAVAGSVGGWMTQLLGLHDSDLLERAHALGHAMQLTNIARDVGDDWRRGRLYLPLALLERWGLAPEDIGSMVDLRVAISESYRGAIGELLNRADYYYERAWPGIRQLPSFLRRPVAAAASAYRGIHREIRRNDFDNLGRRAYTSTSAKFILAGAGLLRSERGS